MDGKRQCFRNVIKLIASSLVIRKIPARASRKSRLTVSELKKLKELKGHRVCVNVKFNYPLFCTNSQSSKLKNRFEIIILYASAYFVERTYLQACID